MSNQTHLTNGLHHQPIVVLTAYPGSNSNGSAMNSIYLIEIYDLQVVTQQRTCNYYQIACSSQTVKTLFS